MAFDSDYAIAPPRFLQPDLDEVAIAAEPGAGPVALELRELERLLPIYFCSISLSESEQPGYRTYVCLIDICPELAFKCRDQPRPLTVRSL